MTENQVRAKNASLALERYRELVCNDIDLEIDISDMIADMMHLCDQEDIDFDRCLNRANTHYAEEKR